MTGIPEDVARKISEEFAGFDSTLGKWLANAITKALRTIQQETERETAERCVVIVKHESEGDTDYAAHLISDEFPILTSSPVEGE